MTVVTSKRRSERRNEIIKISARAWRLIRDYYFCQDRRQLSGSAVEHDVELFHDLSDMIDIDGTQIYIYIWLYIYLYSTPLRYVKDNVLSRARTGASQVLIVLTDGVSQDEVEKAASELIGGKGNRLKQHHGQYRQCHLVRWVITLFSDMTPSREMTFLTLIDFINFLIIYLYLLFNFIFRYYFHQKSVTFYICRTID